jgi:hypothetical protein
MVLLKASAQISNILTRPETKGIDLGAGLAACFVNMLHC